MSTASYKHLDARMKIGGELTFGQLAMLGTGAIVALLYMTYLHPWNLAFTLMTGIWLGGLPILFQLMASAAGISVSVLIGSAWSWWREPGLYTPGPGEVRGYVITADPLERQVRDLEQQVAEVDLEALWD